MSKFFTNDFKLQAIDALIASAPSYYMFLGRHTPYVDDSAPTPIVNNIQQTYIDVYDQMITAKLVTDDDIVRLIPRVDWMSGVVYTPYTHDSSVDLFGRPFYVCVATGSSYDVFKCLNNAGGAPSTVAPSLVNTSPSDDVYETSDGYQWKYLYSITNPQFKKFATLDYIPVYVDANVASFAVNGSIDYVSVEYPGSRYDSYTSGAFQSVSVSGNSQVFYIESTSSANNNFYKGCALKITSGIGAGQQRTVADYTVSGSTRIIVVDTPFGVNPTTSSTYEITPRVVMLGSGSNFEGRALVNAAASNSIYKVEITNRGEGYVYASASLTGNVGGVTNAASFKAMIGPNGGHGSNPPHELGSHYMGISVTFDAGSVEANSKTFNTNDFRVLGIVDSPLLSNVQIDYTGANGAFVLGERITQNDTNATGIITGLNVSTITLTEVNKGFLPSNSTFGMITGNTSGIGAEVVTMRNNGSANLTSISYINQTTFISLNNTSGAFAQDELVTGTGNTQTSNAYIYASNASGVWVTNMRGEFETTLQGTQSGASGNITNIRPGDLVYGSGKLSYIENISPINRVAGQTETIKAIIEF